MKARKTIKTPAGVATLAHFILPLKHEGRDAGYAIYKRGYETSTRCGQFRTGMGELRKVNAECDRLNAAA